MVPHRLGLRIRSSRPPSRGEIRRSARAERILCLRGLGQYHRENNNCISEQFCLRFGQSIESEPHRIRNHPLPLRNTMMELPGKESTEFDKGRRDTAGFNFLTTAMGANVESDGSLAGEESNPAMNRFTGKPYDEDLQAYVFPFRNYSAKLARWTSADPAGFPDGPNRHFYAPVPTMGLDPMGLALEELRFESNISAGTKSWVNKLEADFNYTFSSEGPLATHKILDGKKLIGKSYETDLVNRGGENLVIEVTVELHIADTSASQYETRLVENDEGEDYTLARDAARSVFGFKVITVEYEFDDEGFEVLGKRD